MSRPQEKVQPELSEDYIVFALRQLTAELPMNDFGLPTGIYRTDLLPFHEYVPPGSSTGSDKEVDEAEADTVDMPEPDALAPSIEVSADAFSLLSGDGDGLPDMIVPARVEKEVPSKAVGEYRIAGFPAASLQTAFVPLQYDEGFPAFEDGRPFWGRLDFEPGDAYLMFQRYLMMSFGRAADPEDEDDFGIAAQGTRSIAQLVHQTGGNLTDDQVLRMIEKLKSYYHLHYWGLRTKSYDLFRVTEYQQKQELRAIETQDDHYVQSRKLRARLSQYMDDDEDFWDMMTPAVAIKLHEHLTKLERISAGVPAAGPQTKDGEGSRSFEMAFRTIAQDHTDSSAGDGATIDQEGHVLDKALEDPNATKILQELIIRGN